MGGDIYFSHGNNQSRGVAILVPNNLKARIKVNKLKIDDADRMIVMDCVIDGYHLVLINVYAPTKDHRAVQNYFFNILKQTKEDNGNKTLLIGSDFNTYLDCEIDKKGGKTENVQEYTKNIHSIMDEYNLTDTWRTSYGCDLKYTWRENTKSGLVQSRLDFFLISTQLAYQVQKCHILPRLRSDHSLVKLTLSFLNT